MARRRRITRRRTPAKKSFFRRKSKGDSAVKLIQFDSMIYGGLRAYTSNLLAPITSKIPFGSISDEVVLGATNWLIARNTSGLLKDIATKGLIIENARLGEAIVTGQVGFGTFENGGSSAGNGFLYG